MTHQKIPKSRRPFPATNSDSTVQSNNQVELPNASAMPRLCLFRREWRGHAAAYPCLRASLGSTDLLANLDHDPSSPTYYLPGQLPPIPTPSRSVVGRRTLGVLWGGFLVWRKEKGIGSPNNRGTFRECRNVVVVALLKWAVERPFQGMFFGL